MAQYRYETHEMRTPLLPFIYHPRFELHQHGKIPNWHENIELLQITEGEGFVRCDAQVFPAIPGDLFVINADELHNFGSDTKLVYRCLILDNSFLIANGIPAGSLLFQNRIRDEGVYGLFENIAQAYERYDASDFRTVLAIRAGVLQLLQALCSDYITQRPAQPSNEYIKKAMTFIRRNLTTTLTLDAIADYVGISKYHFARQFKAFTGKTVVQTVNLMRCTEARRLMEDGMSVSAAAASCGYENLSYFTRTFKTYMGRLPSHIETK